MNCPKCEEGILSKIQFKRSREVGLLCNMCGSLWLEDEPVSVMTGHILPQEDYEYDIDDTNEKDQEHQATIPERQKE